MYSRYIPANFFTRARSEVLRFNLSFTSPLRALVSIHQLSKACHLGLFKFNHPLLNPYTFTHYLLQVIQCVELHILSKNLAFSNQYHTYDIYHTDKSTLIVISVAQICHVGRVHAKCLRCTSDVSAYFITYQQG